MDEPRDKEPLEEVEDEAENDTETREPGAPAPVLNHPGPALARPVRDPDRDSRKEGGGFVRGLIWLIVLALIAWGGYTAYKNRNAEVESSSETATTTAITATGTPEQPTQ